MDIILKFHKIILQLLILNLHINVDVLLDGNILMDLVLFALQLEKIVLALKDGLGTIKLV